MDSFDRKNELEISLSQLEHRLRNNDEDESNLNVCKLLH